MACPDRRQWLKLCAAGSAVALAGCASLAPYASDPATGDDPGDNPGDDGDPWRIDDWQYDPEKHVGIRGGPTAMTPVADAAAESIGLAAGGAADVGTFRRNVYEGFLPLPESMTYEGLFHEYYFDTGGDGSCGSLFCPTYTPAVSPDPLSGETERYLSVGLDSGLAQSEFERPPLNLVLVLDISGSMSASFDRYYYDQYGNRREIEDGDERSKMAVARDVLADLTHNLRPDDRLGVVLFNSDATVAKPLRKVERTDMDAIREHIREDLQAGGGTNISAGMEDAEGLLESVVEEGDRTYEHRTILLTDAQVNLGETDADELRSNLERRAEQRMHTTVVGVGVDFNADLINQLTAVRGANYYSVYSASQFEQRMVEEFEYMVTPLVYDLSLALDADGYDIERVYGSPGADEATGELLHVDTLFPSPAEDGRAKGGVVLVQIEETDGPTTPDGAELELEATWERRDGTTESAVETLTFPTADEYWGNDAVRKAVLLARHATLLKRWTVDERDRPELPDPVGIEPPEEHLDRPLGEWELQSQPLSVSPENANRFEAFRGHFESEATALGDEQLAQEFDLLDAILDAA